MKSPFRDDFVIHGFHFGGPKKTVAIVGPMRGDEAQQLFVASQIVKNLTHLERQGRVSNELGILVIPTVNSFSLNVHKRFWAMDNTDILLFIKYDSTDKWQITIFLSIIQSIAHYKFIRNCKTGVIHMNICHTAIRLVQKGTDTNIFWLSLI